MLNGALVIEMVNNYFTESKKNFCCLIKWGTLESKKKIEIWAVKNMFPLDFAKYLSYSSGKEQQSC